MARSTTTQTPCLLVWSLVAALISQTLLLPVSSSSFHDQKNFFYFPPVIPGTPPIDPGTPPIDPGTPPIDPGSPPFTLTPPVVPSPPIVPTPPIVPSPPTGGYTYPPPTHGSGSPPPVHHSPPHHGGDHHHGGSPPSNCGNPTPPKHVDPSPPHHHNPSPSPPHHHNPSPSPPTGGYNYNPPSSGGTPPTPTVPSYSPPVVLPPTTPTSPPFDPNTHPIGGTCDFWRNHPGIIWGLFGWWGTTMGSAFGTPTLPGTGSQLNLLQALSNTRTDGFGALYREGTASLLNSMVNKNFPYSTSHVKDSFVAAVGSNKAAAAQARVFKLANEGHMKLRV